MGRLSLLRSRNTPAGASAPKAEDRVWHERALLAARAHGRMPYLVDGFVEVTEAVRRGHAVVLQRVEQEVAEGVTVFARRIDGPVSGPAPIRAGNAELVTVVRFDPVSARYVLTDAASTVGSLELTPKRLQRYLADPARATGVALGA
ncbi:MAG: hypothetical protein H7123_01590 [Thermoleophilia bacterium]|nr:hypothetical protein [Thermoleophilia bacterium]